MHQTGHQGSVHLQQWPGWESSSVPTQVIEIPIQINGKKRTVIEVDSSASQSEIEKAAFESPKVMQYIFGQNVLDVIYVPGKILNIRTDQSA